MFQTVPVQVVGPSYQHRSLPLSAQSTKNMYPEVLPSGKVPHALLPWPGYVGFSASASAADRGMHVFNNVLYQVAGTTLYSISSGGTRTTIGTIAGNNRCIFADDGTSLVIVTGSTGYYYSGGTLSQITDADYVGGDSVAQYSTLFIYHNADDDYCISDAGTPNTINGLNKGSITAKSGNIKRVYVKNKLVYFFKEKSFEIYYPATGNPPVDEVQNAKGDIGAASVHGVCETTDFVYFVGHDKQVYRIQQFQEQKITPPAIANAFESYTTSDAIAYSMLLEGQWFVVVRFPTSGKSWMYCEMADSWVELTSGNLETIYPPSSYAYCYGKHLVADADTGEIWELNLDTFTNDGDEIIRERVTMPISGVQIQQPGKRLEMSRFELLLETGVGTATGDGAVPQVMFSASFDGGKSWTNEDWIEIGRTGEGRIKVEWYHMESFYDAVIKIRISDPVFFTIQAAAIDIQLDGDY